MKLPAALTSIKPSKTWAVLAVALTVGVLAALYARSYLAGQMAAIEARSQGKTIALVVAKSDLARGAKLTPGNVAVRQVPADYAHSAGVTPEQFERIEGEPLAFTVKSGEMILWSMVEGKRVPTFSARVENGRRAMTVPVDEINSISGMLEPGDKIDLIVTLDQRGTKKNVALLQGVDVMATGQRSVDDPKSGERRNYSTVTLDTSPKEAQNIIIAREVGKLTALLRNPQDEPAERSDGVDMAKLIGGKDAVAGPRAAAERRVPVLYGGASRRPSAEELSLLSAAAAAAAPPATARQ